MGMRAIMVAVPEVVVPLIVDVLLLLHIPGTVNGTAATACENK